MSSWVSAKFACNQDKLVIKSLWCVDVIFTSNLCGFSSYNPYDSEAWNCPFQKGSWTNVLFILKSNRKFSFQIKNDLAETFTITKQPSEWFLSK